MKIGKDEIMHVAGLARLDIDKRSIDSFESQLGKILDYIEALNSVDTKGIPPTFHAISIENAFREDEEENHLDREKALANAPEIEEGSFMVPKIIES
jgi:aspartyl-tRNA(Asn)/glutamyl-tRNA(Gln) amidotransferase subunit C